MAKGFFDLPLELRLMIYEELLVSPHPVCRPRSSCQCPSTDHSKPQRRETIFRDLWTVRRRRISSSFCARKMQLHPAILAVNQQIYFEAIGVLYSKNRFKLGWNFVDDRGLPPSWLKEIGPALGALIRHVRLPVGEFLYEYASADSNQNTFTFRLREACPNIRSFELVDRVVWPVNRPGCNCFWVPARKALSIRQNVLKVKRCLEVSVPAVDFTLVVEYGDRKYRGRDRELETKWQEVIGLWREYGWKYRFENLEETTVFPFLK